MTKTLLFLPVLFSMVAAAQFQQQPTRFDKFITKSKIEWAAYASDTFNFGQAGLNTLLLNRLTKKEIRAGLPFESRTKAINNTSFITRDSIDNAFYGINYDIMMDTAGNDIMIKRPIPAPDTATFKLTEVTQILYVQNGILKSYIPFITPTLPVYMSTGYYIGQRFYFNTCYNFSYNCASPKRNRQLFLAQTKKRIDPDQGNLKEMFGQNLVETLWPHVLNNEIAVFALDDNRELNPQEINSNLTFDQPVITPIYNPEGAIVDYKVIAAPIDPKKFVAVELVQDWYYNHKKNKVFSHVKEMVLYANKSKETEDKHPVPVLKLVFK